MRTFSAHGTLQRIPTVCISGMYGQHCSKQCSEFCQNKECYEDTGSCLNGCERGYNGSHCNNCKLLHCLLYSFDKFYLL